MRRGFQRPIAACVVLFAAALPGFAQSASAAKYVAPRGADGKPDLQGIWQARNTAAGDLEDHGASMGIPAGRGVIVDPPDGKIPYQPGPRKSARRTTRIAPPRTPGQMLPGRRPAHHLPALSVSDFPDAAVRRHRVRIRSRHPHHPLNGSKHLEDIDFWMGDSRGHWEGNTLVVEVADLNEQTWLDLAGDFHSDSMKLVERYTRTGPDTLQYEVTIEDPKVFTRPWKISMPLYRHTEKDFQIYEYECPCYWKRRRKERK